jgi:hypothetical protein
MAGGDRYEGEFRNDLYHGKGVYYFYPKGLVMKASLPKANSTVAEKILTRTAL